MTAHAAISSTFMDLAHLDLHLDVCRASLDVAAEVGASVLVWHSGGAWTGARAGIDAALARERGALAAVAPHAAGCGVTLAVENVFGKPDRWNAGPADLAAQIDAVGHPSIRACIDFSHGLINAGLRGDDFHAGVAALAPFAAHLHVHDSFGRPSTFAPWTPGDAVAYGLGDLHLPPGWSGALDWLALAALDFPADAEICANLELSSRHSDEIPAAIALCRRMAAISQDHMPPS